jgi:30S ribosomal protein S31
MGKGDKKTKRGKLFMGSYGVSRPKKTDVKSTKPEEKK